MKDINLLHPQLRSLCQKLVALAEANGIRITITQTFRTQEEQEGLYAQGRTKPGMIVTHVKYPYSLHCWGLAFDIAVIVDGEVNWTRIDLYDKVGELGKSLGLKWGGDFKSFKDRPHFELPGFNVGEIMGRYGTPQKFSAQFDPEPENVLFEDLSGHWAEADVKWLMENGIVQSARKYRPNEPLTRAEAAALMARTVQFLLTKMKD